MKQEIAVNRVLRDLKMMGLIDEEYSGEVRPYLNQLWVAAWEQRGKEYIHNQRPLLLLTNKGELIQEYPNSVVAIKEAKYSKKILYKALHTGLVTDRGHIWQYKKSKNKKLLNTP